jgi:hypothetical protein
MGAASVGMGNIATLNSDVWSAFNNPAGIGISPRWAIGIQHEQRYTMAELGISALAATIPILGGGIGLSLTNTGFSEYGENLCGLKIGRKLGSTIYAGIGLQMHLLRFPDNYHNAFAISGNAGVYAVPGEHFIIGVYISNLSFSRFNNKERDKLPVLLLWGMAYKINDNNKICAEIEKDIYAALRIKGGVECLVAGILYLRSGVLSHPFQIHFGLGYKYKSFQVDFAIYRHPTLGFSPQLSFSSIFQ